MFDVIIVSQSSRLLFFFRANSVEYCPQSIPIAPMALIFCSFSFSNKASELKKLILLVACFFYTADNESIHHANSQEETSKDTFTKIQQKNYT